jgi:hypothetical protein
VARHFKATPISPPAELLTFDPKEWVELGDRTWANVFRHWQEARHAWVEKHPGESILGDLLDCLRDERRLKGELWDVLSEPL